MGGVIREEARELSLLVTTAKLIALLGQQHDLFVHLRVFLVKSHPVDEWNERTLFLGHALLPIHSYIRL